jgi:hypothetical protein
MCSKCGKGRWLGSKKDGKFTCVECLAKEDKPKEEIKAEEGGE